MRSRSTDLHIAVDQVRQAEAQTRIALARYLPSISGTGTYTRQLLTNEFATPIAVITPVGIATSNVVPVRNTFDGHLDLRQAVLDVSALDQIGIARQAETASTLSLNDKMRTLLLGLADQIVAVVTAEHTAQINRVGLQRALEQLEIARRSQALGASTALDVVRAEQNAANARAALVAGDEVLREAREALGLVLGFPEETGVAPGVNVDGVALEAASLCKPAGTIEQRPDVAAARAGLEVANRNVRNVWYGFLPTVSAQSRLDATSVVAVGSPNPTWSVEGVLTIPIWDGGGRYGTLRNARASADIAAQQLEALRRQAAIQVEQARRRLVVAETSTKVAREQRDLAARNDQLTQAAFIAGQGTSLELVTASEAHRQAELNLALREYDVVTSRLNTIFALVSCP
jgi:outer membrane protein TolC